MPPHTIKVWTKAAREAYREASGAPSGSTGPVSPRRSVCAPRAMTFLLYRRLCFTQKIAPTLMLIHLITNAFLHRRHFVFANFANAPIKYRNLRVAFSAGDPARPGMSDRMVDRIAAPTASPDLFIEI